MKLIDLTKIQVAKNGQMSVVFSKDVKHIVGTLGWEKGTPIQILRHGKGLMIVRNEEVRALERLHRNLMKK